MKIAMEIPVPHLEELSEVTDFDFALAHKVLEDPESEYVKFYKRQAMSGRDVWLDNSIHELGRCLPLFEIVSAAEMIHATHIVAPEYWEDPMQTRVAIYNLKEILNKRADGQKVVGAWQGFKKDLVELLQLCDVVALPFRRHRGRVINEGQFSSKDFHYFGYKNLDELRIRPPKSIDTSMPIRAAIYSLDLERRERRPQTPLLDLSRTLTKDELRLAKYNVELLRRAARGRR